MYTKRSLYIHKYKCLKHWWTSPGSTSYNQIFKTKYKVGASEAIFAGTCSKVNTASTTNDKRSNVTVILSDAILLQTQTLVILIRFMLKRL